RAVADHCAASVRVLDERNQLRGRLDAYQAKAVTLGLAERPELAALYEHAHGLLYTAPTDLVEATEPITLHQATLARLAASSGAGRLTAREPRVPASSTTATAPSAGSHLLARPSWQPRPRWFRSRRQRLNHRHGRQCRFYQPAHRGE